MNNGRPRQNEKVIVVDVIGELFKVYSLATIVYCGGSLVPKGGQNILEAAAWGKVIFYGPFMDDFSTEAALLEDAGAGIRIRNPIELLENIAESLLIRRMQESEANAAGRSSWPTGAPRNAMLRW